MAHFKLNPEFNRKLQVSITECTYTFANLAKDIIEISRFWENWETSDPFRDIVDTGALDESMQVQYKSALRLAVYWYAYYVGFVYFGYTLKDGRRIPPRPWIDLAIQENDLLSIFTAILKKHLELI